MTKIEIDYIIFIYKYNKKGDYSMSNWIEQALEESEAKLKVAGGRIGAGFVHKAPDCKKWMCDDYAGSWINGYWPGIIWMLYDMTGNIYYRNIALECINRLDKNVIAYDPLSHDVGFMYMLACKPDYNLFNNEISKKRLLFMADLLAGRFNIKGSFIRAWEEYVEDPHDVCGWAIIDCTMNLPLLFWASEETGDPRFSHIAKAHADTVLKYFIRKDGSVNHICEFDKHTGEFIRVRGGQGYSPDSAWSRGASWAIHGLALVYGYTNDIRYLEGAKEATDFFLEHLPEDNVPYWDMLAPIEPDMPRDASAGANAASGMLEIAKHTEGEEKEYYTNCAVRILKSLWDNYYIHDQAAEPLLKGSTIHKPAGYGINCSVVYADYYFIEALRKLQGRDEIYLW